MKKSLIDVIFASDKRKNVLLFLSDGPKEMRLILDNLKTTRAALLPQMKILKNHDLICQTDDIYELTSIGKLVSDEMKPFLDTVEAIDENNNYFSTHKLDGIPQHMLKRIGEIKGSVYIEPDYVNVHELNTDYQLVGYKSKEVYFVYTFMHPGAPSVLHKLMEQKINVGIIYSQELAQKLINELYDECKYFLSFENLKLYTYEKDIGISSITVTDTGFLLRLLTKNGQFSNKQLIVTSEQGRKWGMDLYNYYLKDAKLITDI